MVKILKNFPAVIGEFKVTNRISNRNIGTSWLLFECITNTEKLAQNEYFARIKYYIVFFEKIIIITFTTYGRF